MDIGWLACITIAFLVGSIPTGYLLARAHGIDIRQHGSRNIGATNVLRVLGKRPGIICFALDVLKGFAPVLGAGIAMDLVGETARAGELPGAAALTGAQGLWWMAVVCAAVAGHMYTPWLAFKGGKGVATGVGSLLGVVPYMTLPAVISLAVFVVTLRIWRYVSVSSCAAAVSIPVSAWAIPVGFTALGWTDLADRARTPGSMIGAAAALAGVVIFKHRTNFRRLLAGTEFRVGQRIPTEPTPPAHAARPPAIDAKPTSHA